MEKSSTSWRFEEALETYKNKREKWKGSDRRTKEQCMLHTAHKSQNNGFTSRWSGKLIPRIQYCISYEHKPYDFFYRFAFGLTKKTLHDSPRDIFSLFSFHFILSFSMFFFFVFSFHLFIMSTEVNGWISCTRFMQKWRRKCERLPLKRSIVAGQERASHFPFAIANETPSRTESGMYSW